MNEKLRWKQLRWLLLAGGISILLVRDSYLIVTGGGRLCAAGDFLPWLLLFFEWAMSAVAAIGSFGQWIQWPLFNQALLFGRLLSSRVILVTAVVAVILHLVRLSQFLLNL